VAYLGIQSKPGNFLVVLEKNGGKNNSLPTPLNRWYEMFSISVVCENVFVPGGVGGGGENNFV